MNMQENRQRHDALRRERRDLEAEAAKLATYDRLSGAQERRFVDVNDRLSAIRDELEDLREQRLANAERFAKQSNAVKPVTERFNVNRGTDPYDPHNRDDVLARARQSVEEQREATDDAKHAATRLLEKAATEIGSRQLEGIGEYILATGQTAYVSAFREYVRDPEFFGRSLTNEQVDAMRTVQELDRRSAMSLTAGNGGYMVPHFLDPTIVLTNAGTANDVRQISRVEQITTTTWEGVTSANANAEWLGELSTAADATPTFQGPQVTTHKAAAWVWGSVEVIADAQFDAIAVLMADAFDRLEETAFATGDAVSAPQGLITALSGAGPTVTCTSAAGASEVNIVAADPYKLDNVLGPRFRRNAAFMANRTLYNSLRQVATANNSASFWVDFPSATPSTLIGHSVHENAGFPATFTSASNQYGLLLGDFQNYLIADRIGTSISFVPTLMSSGVARPMGASGWFAYKRVGAGVLTSNAFAMLVM